MRHKPVALSFGKGAQGRIASRRQHYGEVNGECGGVGQNWAGRLELSAWVGVGGEGGLLGTWAPTSTWVPGEAPSWAVGAELLPSWVFPVSLLAFPTRCLARSSETEPTFHPPSSSLTS